MAVNFPSNPTNGQTITVSGITYAYDSTQGVWSDSPQGLTQAIDALTDVDTSTVAPTNGQVLQWNSTDSEWQPADSSAGVTVYATINDLPLSGVAEGSMALVDSTDKLYIFSDSGWYSISIVNTTPSISGVSATYTLATDGTATVVTVTATDPEGIPITYSIVSDTSGNIATVTQGTGANTNQWTITPSTNTANAGNFTLVFRASDGVNIASASSTFSLTFLNLYSGGTWTLAGGTYDSSIKQEGTHSLKTTTQSTSRKISGYDSSQTTISEYTIAMWVRFGSNSVSNSYILWNADDKTSASNIYGSCAVRLDTASGYFAFNLSPYNGSSYCLIENNNVNLSVNTWYHIILAYNATTDRANGWITTSGGTLGNVWSFTNTQPPRQGSGLNLSTLYLAGSVGATSTNFGTHYYDDVHILNGTITSQQATDLLAGTSPPSTKYRFRFNNSNANA